MTKPSKTRTPFPISVHAELRIIRRDINAAALEIVLQHGADFPAGAGAKKRRLLRHQAAELAADGMANRLLENARRIEAVVSADEMLVTCYLRAPSDMVRDVRRRRPVARQMRVGGLGQ